MPLANLDDIQAVARRGAPASHDEYSERTLVARLEEYLTQRRGSISPYALKADGVPYPNLYAALRSEDAKFETAELTLRDPPPAGKVWEYVRPFRSVTFHPDGAADVVPLDPGSPAQRAIARVVLREHFVPRSLRQESAEGKGTLTPGPETSLASLSQSIRFVRATGIIPFAVAVFLYFSDERVTLEVDVVDHLLLKDARAGRISLSRRVRRPARVAFGVDQFVARGELSVLSARALEALADTHGLTVVELSHVLGGPRELATSSLEALVARRLATFDKRTGLYRPRLEAFLTAAERVQPREESLPFLPNPALRTSVRELIAAADARATCPLCGDPLPPGPRRILCPRCEAEVGTEGGPA